MFHEPGITLYLGVALVYELLPFYSGRPWKNSRLIAIAWNVVLLIYPSVAALLLVGTVFLLVRRPSPP